MNLPKASVTVMLGKDMLFALTEDNRVHAAADRSRRAIIATALGRAAIALAQLFEQPGDFEVIRSSLDALERMGTPEALSLRADLDVKLNATMAAAQAAAAFVAAAPNTALN